MMGNAPGGNVVPITNEGSGAMRPVSVPAVPRNFLVTGGAEIAANDVRFNQSGPGNDPNYGVVAKTESGDEILAPKAEIMPKVAVGVVDVVPKTTTAGEYPGTLVGNPVQIRETTGDAPGIMVGEPRKVETMDFRQVGVVAPSNITFVTPNGNVTIEKPDTEMTESAYTLQRGDGFKQTGEVAPSTVSFKNNMESPASDKVLDQAPSQTDPEKAKEALSRLEKVKNNQEGFFSRLKNKLSVSPEKWEAIKEKVAKAADAYNNLEPKTKLAIGLSLASVGMIGVASGAPLVAGVIAAARGAVRIASTKAMYDGLVGALDKKYKELGEGDNTTSPARQKIMKLGALGLAGLVNFAGADAITNTLEATGAFDKVSSVKEWVANAFTPLNATPLTVEDSLSEGESIVRGEDAVSHVPEEEPAKQTGSGYGTTVIAPHATETAAAASSPLATAETTLSGVINNPTYGFDAASAPPVGSTEVFDEEGRGVLMGWKLPDGSFMDQEGRVTKLEPSVIANVPPEASAVETQAFDKFDNQIEESFARTSPMVEVATAMETPSTNIVLEDGAVVQAGETATTSTTVEATTAPLQPIESVEISGDRNVVNVEVGQAAEVGQTPITNDAVQWTGETSGIKATDTFRPNFAQVEGSSLTGAQQESLATLQSVSQNETFKQAFDTASKDVAKAQSWLFANPTPVRESFMTVLNQNPGITVENLTTAKLDGLDSKQQDLIKNARGVLTHMFDESTLTASLKDPITKVLERNFNA